MVTATAVTVQPGEPTEPRTTRSSSNSLSTRNRPLVSPLHTGFVIIRTLGAIPCRARCRQQLMQICQNGHEQISRSKKRTSQPVTAQRPRPVYLDAELPGMLCRPLFHVGWRPAVSPGAEAGALATLRCAGFTVPREARLSAPFRENEQQAGKGLAQYVTVGTRRSQTLGATGRQQTASLRV